MSHKVRVWDLPTRVFHWVLALCVLALLITGEVGGDAMPWHFRLGYLTLSLLLFRLAWGFVGGYWSRFASFVRGPSAVLAYLKGQGQPEFSVGHNPLAAGSVLALLTVLLAQVGTGLCSDDEIATAGPLAKFVSNAVVSAMSFYHTEVGKLLVIFLVLLHVVAIVFYKIKKKQDLITPMLRGDKELDFAARATRDDTRRRLLALLLWAVFAAAIAWAAYRLD